MPAYKNQKTGEWYCIFRVTDWTGKRKQIKKSCFARRADALAYEREYLAKKLTHHKNEIRFPGGTLHGRCKNQAPAHHLRNEAMDL